MQVGRRKQGWRWQPYGMASYASSAAQAGSIAQMPDGPALLPQTPHVV